MDNYIYCLHCWLKIEGSGLCPDCHSGNTRYFSFTNEINSTTVFFIQDVGFRTSLPSEIKTPPLFTIVRDASNILIRITGSKLLKLVARHVECHLANNTFKLSAILSSYRALEMESLRCGVPQLQFFKNDFLENKEKLIRCIALSDYWDLTALKQFATIRESTPLKTSWLSLHVDDVAYYNHVREIMKDKFAVEEFWPRYENYYLELENIYQIFGVPYSAMDGHWPKYLGYDSNIQFPCKLYCIDNLEEADPCPMTTKAELHHRLKRVQLRMNVRNQFQKRVDEMTAHLMSRTDHSASTGLRRQLRNPFRLWCLGWEAADDLLEDKPVPWVIQRMSLALLADSMRSVGFSSTQSPEGNHFCSDKEFLCDVDRMKPLDDDPDAPLFSCFFDTLEEFYDLKGEDYLGPRYESTQNMEHFRKLLQLLMSELDLSGENETEAEVPVGETSKDSHRSGLHCSSGAAKRAPPWLGESKSTDERSSKPPWSTAVEATVCPEVLMLAGLAVLGVILAFLLVALQVEEIALDALASWRTLYGNENLTYAATLARNCFVIGALLGLEPSSVADLGLDHDVGPGPSHVVAKGDLDDAGQQQSSVSSNSSVSSEETQATVGEDATVGETPPQLSVCDSPIFPSSEASSASTPAYLGSKAKRRPACKYCLHTFSSISNRNTHERNVHIKACEYRCRYCHKTSTNRKNLENHEKHYCKSARKARASPAMPSHTLKDGLA
ncbi:hypothetical protein BU24DRAFT_458580 [Aaosphaeria arxii CBS 175.79]|uniref:C2H2-type domain-containing protein n=1 Tax=Aaosphaeria arxii CBS 175.79 TaxID=1450172 RepID=A0A6A5Y0U3_9PLEO|nr:uncharacterized protein BU24DRAFT_458580 [Aaosphaeria arxii CBS 175.79]KAF2018846.1 hypothetical protein BU24DRAFT_458580 [Aaosphaeria arxii CBS 175.79]